MNLQAIDPYPSRRGSEAQVFSRLDPVVYSPEEKWPQGHGLLSEHDIRFFEKNGFIQLESLLAADEVKLLAGEADRLRYDSLLARREEAILEPSSKEVRSIFDAHRFSADFHALLRDPRITDIVSYLLADELYLHQARLNYKPGFHGKEFYWHSDFETWHVEDGMPSMRAISVSIALTDNYTCNGPVMVIPGSHRNFLSCSGLTPEENYKSSLRQQRYGVPDEETIKSLVDANGIAEIVGKAGSVLFFDSNLLHGSASNITPYSRTNLFFVYNAVSNRLREPFSLQAARPEYIAHRTNIEFLTSGISRA